MTSIVRSEIDYSLDDGYKIKDDFGENSTEGSSSDDTTSSDSLPVCFYNGTMYVRSDYRSLTHREMQQQDEEFVLKGKDESQKPEENLSNYKKWKALSMDNDDLSLVTAAQY